VLILRGLKTFITTPFASALSNCFGWLFSVLPCCLAFAIRFSVSGLHSNDAQLFSGEIPCVTAEHVRANQRRSKIFVSIRGKHWDNEQIPLLPSTQSPRVGAPSALSKFMMLTCLQMLLAV